jgi:CubicO group peptidase (beta-lactamase class C family)
MTLVESGTIELDEPVRTYLPAFTLADPALADCITVRHLLEQTSGIPEATGVTDRFERRSDPFGTAVVDLADVTPLSAPGEEHVYSSANYLLLGALVEQVTGQPFAAYLRAHVLDPLHMDGAITTPDQARATLPGGHSYAFGQPIGVTPHYDPTGPSYGYLGGTVENLAHFAMAQLDDGRYGSTQVLDAASVAMTHHGTARVSDTVRYGLGWREDDRNADLGTRTIWHGGASPGYQALIVLLPGIDRGIVVLQNIYGFFQDSQLVASGLGAARILAGGQPDAAPTDLTYPLLLTVLTAVLIGAVSATGLTLYRLIRPTTRPERSRRILAGTVCWTLTGLALAYLAGVLAPDAFRASLGLIRLWAPDVGWLLVAISATGLALAAVRLANGLVRLRRVRVRDEPAV